MLANLANAGASWMKFDWFCGEEDCEYSGTRKVEIYKIFVTQNKFYLEIEALGGI